MKPGYLVVLDALSLGCDVQIGDLKYRMRDNHLLFLMDCENSETGEKNVKEFGCDMSVTHFMKECEKLTKEELFLIGGDATLRSMQKEKAKKRRETWV